MIRRARPAEAAAISALAIASKRHWGDDAAQMRLFEGELTLTPADVKRAPVFVLEEEGRLLGFFALAERTPADGRRLGLDASQAVAWLEGAIELEHLFIHPACLGRGHGRGLLERAGREAVRCGARCLVVQSDPHAAGFYAAGGFEHVHDLPSSIPGRMLPFFRRVLAEGG